MGDRTANPQHGAIAARARLLQEANFDRGARYASPVRRTFLLLPAPAPAQRPRQLGYDLAMHLRRASTAGPRAYAARLAAINRRGE